MREPNKMNDEICPKCKQWGWKDVIVPGYYSIMTCPRCYDKWEVGTQLPARTPEMLERDCDNYEADQRHYDSYEGAWYKGGRYG